MTAKLSATMTAAPYKVLFICTGNAARGILAEALLNHCGHGRFLAFSAGTHPARTVNRHAVRLLEQQGIATEPLYCKSWDEFAVPHAPPMDCIIFLARRMPQGGQPEWPGHPITVHWGMHDPAAVTGPEARKQRAFRQTFETLQARICYLVSLPVENSDWREIREALDSVAQITVHTEQ